MAKTSPWSQAHIRLRRIYDERVPPDMTQKEFGKRYGIGNQSMVAQYLSGNKPLNYRSATKFAYALRCTIFDICPEAAEELYPILGKPLRRAAAILVCLLAQPFIPSDANAFDINKSALSSSRIHIAFKRLLMMFYSRFVSFA